ncbi:MAG TPA: hypothetical protein VMY43_12400 [Methanothrix sp.]|nr:hypothetical protein [Methanothrix sp.]
MKCHVCWMKTILGGVLPSKPSDPLTVPCAYFAKAQDKLDDPTGTVHACRYPGPCSQGLV